jgi:L-lactate dehydrogenase complex protein LldG
VRRFDWTLDERRDRCITALTAAHAEVYRVNDGWPSVLAQRLQALAVSGLRYGSGSPLARELCIGWPADGPRLLRQKLAIERNREDLFDAAEASITSCRAAIAETGSLVLWPTPAEPRLLSLVPPIHCVLLEADRIVSTLHELMVTEDWASDMPTNAVLISGPSKSADIEQTLAYGVHGPARLIVLVRG